MKQEQIDMIKSRYDGMGEYKINSRYSGEQGAVYTKAGDNAHWLIIERKGKDGAEVRLTDDTGRITARDTYKVIGNMVKCVKARRKGGENKNMVEFDPDEINLIHQYRRDSRQETMNALKAAVSKINDRYARNRILGTMYKLSVLPGENCLGLIRSDNNHKAAERCGSIRRQLRGSKKDLSNQTGTGEKGTDHKRKNSFEL